MKIVLLISILIGFPYVSYAQEMGDLETLCQFYSTHTPDADVQYQGGIDARGNAVISADLNDNRIEMPRIFSIPLQVEQLDALNLSADSVLNPELNVGEVIVDLDSNTVTFNGQDIDRKDLAVLCLNPSPEYEETDQ